MKSVDLPNLSNPDLWHVEGTGDKWAYGNNPWRVIERKINKKDLQQAARQGIERQDKELSWWLVIWYLIHHAKS